MGATRQQICQSASSKLNAALGSLSGIGATVGFDGFVDEIIAVVDKRQDRDHYEPVKTIEQFGGKILKAAKQSSNYELLVKQTKLGGNGPIMANALAAMGMNVTYIGGLGYPAVHPVFSELQQRAKVYSISEPGHTDALEFDDGKLMFGKHQALADINWENLVSRVGLDTLRKLFSSSKLIGMVNWTMLPMMSHIWSKLLEDVMPKVDGKGQTIFVDLADPEKRTQQDIVNAVTLLSQFQKRVNVTLGLNLKESQQILHALNLPMPADDIAAEAAIEQSAKIIRQKTNLACVVIHPRIGAAAATADASAKFEGPFVQQPKISTGAGDHFNAGFCLGRVLGLDLAESLCTGVATSGFYVRTAQSPSGKDLAEFIAKLPPPQG
jgi:sugar/nucleoside kinase (ribokinase family)